MPAILACEDPAALGRGEGAQHRPNPAVRGEPGRTPATPWPPPVPRRYRSAAVAPASALRGTRPPRTPTAPACRGPATPRRPAERCDRGDEPDHRQLRRV